MSTSLDMERGGAVERQSLRHLAAGVAIAIGVLASVATSGLDETAQRTPWFSLQASELGEEISESVRLCTTGTFDASEPVRYQVRARIQGLEPAAASVPVLLSVDGYTATARMNLQWPDDSRRVALAVTRDPDDDAICSPWGRVTIGPLVGDPGDGVIEWQLIVTAVLAPQSTATLELGSDR